MEHNNYGCSQWLLYADRLWSYRSVAPNHLNKKNREDVCFVSSTVIFMASVQTDYKYTHIYPTIHSHIPNNTLTYTQQYTHIYPTNTLTYTQQIHIIKSHQTAFLLF